MVAQAIPFVDWLSFSVSSPVHRRTGELQWLDPANKTLCRRQSLVEVTRRIGKEAMDTLFGNLDSTIEVGCFPYAYAVIDNTSRARISFDPGLRHISVEVSGIGSKMLHERALVDAVCCAISDTCSRIDVSVDVLTDLSPSEFVAAGCNVRMLSRMTVTSPTGETEYIGSPKSQKRAAVYRYAPPHPRSPYLRIEHRYRHDAAKQMAKYVATNGIAMAVQYAGLEFDWQSPLWDMGDLTAVPMPDLQSDARDRNFANWLLHQVFPAMLKAERQGRIDDLQAFVQTHLFGDTHVSEDDPDTPWIE